MPSCMLQNSGGVEIDLSPASGGTGTDGWVTIIFNNDHNDQGEVIQVLMLATGCGFDEAYCEMWEAHTFGKAPVHFASENECRQAAETISGIGVKTEVRREWD